MIPIPGLLIGLASSLIQAFAPLAREKVEREIARHTDNPAVAEQVASAVIDAAKAATGQADPIAAVAAVKADPAAQAAVQESTLDHLELMAPVLDRLAAMDAAEWSAEESSRTAAAAVVVIGGVALWFTRKGKRNGRKHRVRRVRRSR